MDFLMDHKLFQCGFDNRQVLHKTIETLLKLLLPNTYLNNPAARKTHYKTKTLEDSIK